MEATESKSPWSNSNQDDFYKLYLYDCFDKAWMDNFRRIIPH